MDGTVIVLTTIIRIMIGAILTTVHTILMVTEDITTDTDMATTTDIGTATMTVTIIMVITTTVTVTTTTAIMLQIHLMVVAQAARTITADRAEHVTI